MKSSLTFQMRLARIDQILSGKGEATSEELQESLHCSLPTLKRDLIFMREELDYPVRYHRKTKTYRYEAGAATPKKPVAAWYSATEVKALLTALELFNEVEKDRT